MWCRASWKKLWKSTRKHACALPSSKGIGSSSASASEAIVKKLKRSTTIIQQWRAVLRIRTYLFRINIRHARSLLIWIQIMLFRTPCIRILIKQSCRSYSAPAKRRHFSTKSGKILGFFQILPNFRDRFPFQGQNTSFSTQKCLYLLLFIVTNRI